MLSRLISRTSQLRFLTQISSNPSLSPSINNTTRSSNPLLPTRQILEASRFFSSNRRNNGDGFGKDPSTTSDSWRITPEINDGDSIFGDHDDGNLAGIVDGNGDFDEGSVVKGSSSVGSKNGGGGGDDDWVTAEGYKDWSFDDDEKEEIFDIGEISTSAPIVDDKVSEFEKSQADKLLEQEKEGLSVQLKGPNRAFGDLIAASGITNEMIDSLILLKDFRGVEGLPPLRELEDLRLEKNERKSTNAEIERKKQEEVAKSRVRQVDEKGRAYGTGKRKCSIARVWIQPGDGKFIINDKQFDVYFPILDHRADLLRPFSETKTLGLWDVKCTVKGGGTSGQVGAIRLGISRALQNWEPGLRPYLRSEGFLTRDSRVVERKKPGKAKARKSFQWVKR